MKLIWLMVISVILLIAYLIYDEYTSEKIYVRKDQFHCTMNHIEIQYTPQYDGKGNLVGQIPMMYTICDQLTRNGIK